MIKDISDFTITLLILSGILLGTHYYILNQFEDKILSIPIWSIYLFHTILVLLFYIIIRYKDKHTSEKSFQTFIILTFFKMIFILVFLIPLFQGKSKHPEIEVCNFFIPYFIFLIFEIFSIRKFLKKRENM